MNFGGHTKDVEEVIMFASSGHVMRPHGGRAGGTVYIDNIEEAKRLAWEQPYGSEELLWSDIREREMSRVKGVGYSIPAMQEVKSNLTDIFRILVDAVSRQPGKEYPDLVDEIASDLYNCAYCRAVCGSSDAFFEGMFAVYKSGGWPCGWSGNYPKGALIAYWPTTTDA